MVKVVIRNLLQRFTYWFCIKSASTEIATHLLSINKTVCHSNSTRGKERLSLSVVRGSPQTLRGGSNHYVSCTIASKLYVANVNHNILLPH